MQPLQLGPLTIPTWGYLFGLLAALIPLVIHLSRSRRTKKMRFSTTRFFTEQFLRSYRMSKLRELLLLACRMALFALLALALTGILYTPRGSPSLAGTGPRTVVLVLDDSASMAYSEDGTSLFKRAQEAATSVLRDLPPGDTLSVVLAGRRAEGPEVLFAEPTNQRDEVQRAIDKAAARPLGTDLTGAIARAEELALSARATGRTGAIYVFSDLQESGWESPASPASRAGASDVAFFFVGIHPRKPPANKAVTAVRYAATRPRVGVPFAIRPLLALHGDEGKDVTVRLYVDGAKVGEQKVERLPGGKWASPRFYHTFTAGGWHSGHVEVDDDSLPADNKRHFALEVPETTQTVPVLAVNGAPSSVPHQDELFFLRLALEAAPEGQKSPFKLVPVGPPELAGTDLKQYPLVILANVERLSEQAVEKLEDYVEAGGSLLVFLGDKVNVPFYNETLAGANRRHQGLLPARIKENKPAEVGYIGALDYEHRALASFQEPKLGTLLGPSLTFRALPLEAPEQTVLMKSSKGLPLLCEKAFGKGKVLAFASTCDRDWSDFPVKPGFLLWSRFLTDYLTQSPLSLQSGYRTGEVVRLIVPAGKEQSSLWVRKPGGEKVAVPRSADGSGAFELADTAEPGVYTLLGSDQETRLGLFAVNLENYESDLTYLSSGTEDDPEARRKGVEDELRSLLGRPPVLAYVDDPAALGAGGGSGGRGVKLWNIILVIVLLIGLFEPWLANQISARLYARPKEAPALVLPLPGAVPAPAPRPEEVVR